jgi:hypothetical protein
MPKPKPTQVIRHEIVLGRREFEILETLSAATAINKVSEPIVEILKDGTALLAVAGILEAAGVIDFIPDDVVQSIASGAFSTLDAMIGALNSAIATADAAFDAAAELAEDAAEKAAILAQKASRTQKQLSKIWATAVWLGYTAVGIQPLIDLAGDRAPSWMQGSSPFGRGR